MEPPYDKLDGVSKTVSGYMGGHKDNPSYKQVSAGTTGHTEVVQVTFDPKKVSYEKLVDVFWKNIDPTAKDQQFCDKGSQYRSEIFYHNDKQKKVAEVSLKRLKDSKRFKTIYTGVTKATNFYPAEDYHQDYYQKNPIRYKFYRSRCGRDSRLKELWGK